MRRPARALVLALLALLALGATAVAQPRPGAPGQARRERIKRKIRALRAATLSAELRLDQKTLARMLPMLAKWDDVIEDLLEKRVDLQRRLQRADAMKDPKAIDRLVDQAIANQKAFWSLEEKRLAELRKILTPRQVARLLIVLPAFERRIQNRLRRAIRRGAARGRFDDDPDDPDDLDDDPVPPRRR